MASADTRQDTSPYAKRPVLAPVAGNPPEPADELGFDRPLLLEPFSPEEVTGVPAPGAYQHLIESSKEHDDTRQDQTPRGDTGRLRLTPGAEPGPLPALSVDLLQPSDEDQTPTLPRTPEEETVSALLFPPPAEDDVGQDSPEPAPGARLPVPDTTVETPVRRIPWLPLLLLVGGILVPIVICLVIAFI